MADEKAIPIVKPLEELTLKELRTMAEGLGLVGADIFNSKAPLIATITALRVRESVSEVPVVKDDKKKDEEIWKSKAERMKAKLEKQPKVRFMIPLGIGEKKGAFETVQLNGYRLNILKGVMVAIPQQVADLLAESYQLTAEAGQEFSIERSEDVKKALT